jgi:hypothetical protein
LQSIAIVFNPSQAVHLKDPAKARDNRDRTIHKAREEYAATLTAIATLEQDLLGRESSRHKSIASCINRVVPADRQFTTVDIMAALEALDPRRVWRKRSVDSHISRLRDRGIVRRLSRAKGMNEPAVYIRVGVTAPSLPFEGMTLPEVIAEVLRGRSMALTEIAVAMLEAGYQTNMTPKSLRDAVGVSMRKNGKLFRQVGTRWGLLE